MLRFILFSMILSVLFTPVIYVMLLMDHDQKQEMALWLSRHTVKTKEVPKALYLPPSLALKKATKAKGRVEQFTLPRHEVAVQKFQITLDLPTHYQSIQINAQQQGFYPKKHLNLLDEQNNIADGMILIEAGCFGECDSLSVTLSQLMERDVESFNDQNYLLRTIYFKIHQKLRFDYALWYQDHDGKNWFYGRSVYGKAGWLEAISCQYFEIVDIKHENDQSFKAAWESWSPKFDQYCLNLGLQTEH